MIKINKIFIFILTLALVVLPVFVFAQNDDALVQCGRGNGPECSFNDALGMINRVINFTLKNLVLPIAAIMFAYAGFLLITAGGEAAHARQKAKEIFTNTAIGIVIAAGCYLIIKFFLSVLGYSGTWIGF